MDWEDELMFAVGMTPGYALGKQAMAAVVRQRAPTEKELAMSLAATATGATLIALFAPPIVKEAAQYITLNQFINVKKTADTGQIVWRLGPRMVPWLLYGYAVWQMADKIGKPAGEKMRQEFIIQGGADERQIMKMMGFGGMFGAVS